MSGLPVVYADFAHQLERELASVTAERNALLADKARMDWIEHVICGENCSLYHALDQYWDNTERPTLRAAIDAAKGGAR
jgi:hypothetical protein